MSDRHVTKANYLLFQVVIFYSASESLPTLFASHARACHLKRISLYISLLYALLSQRILREKDPELGVGFDPFNKISKILSPLLSLSFCTQESIHLLPKKRPHHMPNFYLPCVTHMLSTLFYAFVLFGANFARFFSRA